MCKYCGSISHESTDCEIRLNAIYDQEDAYRRGWHAAIDHCTAIIEKMLPDTCYPIIKSIQKPYPTNTKEVKRVK